MNRQLRLIISSDPAQAEMPYSGMLPGDPVCPCPNCRKPLFPVVNISNRIIGIPWLEADVVIRLHHCPWCALWLRPYHAKLEHGKWVVRGGDASGGEILNPNVDLPYGCSAIRWVSMDVPEPSDTYGNRKAEGGIYHQFWGQPIWATAAGKLPGCSECGEGMAFLGILDSDDRDVPLGENGGQGLAVLIGDLRCLNLHNCPSCRVISYQPTR